MTTTEITTEALRVSLDKERNIVVVPTVRVTIVGARAEVSGYVHVVVYGGETTTVHHYEILVESWTTDVEQSSLQRTIEYITARTKVRAEEYVNALRRVLELGVEINFRDGVASKSWLPEWLQRYLE